MLKPLLAAALSLSAWRLPAQQTTHTFTTQGDHFTLDGKPFKVLSGELHYARIPREYWHARLKMARAMGLNTVATYVFWNVHEPTPGHFDFSGNNDLHAFIQAAQQEGLYVILRSGPYSCAEWDLGGIPPWLLKDPASAQALRSNSPFFLEPADKWIERLGNEVADLQVGRGGPILMTQVENEYGNYGPVPGDQPHAYMSHLRDTFVRAGFTQSLLFSGDNWRNIPKGDLDGLFAATNFGIGNHQGGMDKLAEARPGQALFVSEYWPGWFDHWGHPHETRPVGPQIEDLDYILKRGAGINIYMFHGGTSFGFMAGSSYIDNHFLPDVTSYDYDAPLDESGRPTAKFAAYRAELAKFACPGGSGESCLPPIPPSPPTITIPSVTLSESSSLWASLPTPEPTDAPASMETFSQNFGYILYRTRVPTAGNLVLTGVHDFAQVYLDGKLVGTLDRRNADPKGQPPGLSLPAPGRLDILVANDGRINSTRNMRFEEKGLVGQATLAGQTLHDWQVFSLPMNSAPNLFTGSSLMRNPLPQAHAPSTAVGRLSTPYASATVGASPAFRRAHFNLSRTGDTFLDISHLGKGALWINGHAIGRFWNAGPQQTLYVPGPWLRKGSNEIVVFDMMPPSAAPAVAGLDHPILDGKVTEATRSNQE